MKSKENYKIVFLILHYQNAAVTRNCIAYIMGINGISQCITVIVDNGSPNGSGHLLEQEYKDNDRIHLLRFEKNKGFASGNNLGYAYAKNQLSADVIIAMNSDVYIIDSDFLRCLKHSIDNHLGTQIIAPDIVVKKGYHQNPYLLHPIKTVQQKKIILCKEIGYVLYSVPFLGSMLVNRKKVREYQPYQIMKEKNILFNIVPHGACVIYLPDWIKNEEFAFVEGTFLFAEEELLFDYCMKKKYTIKYIPDLVVNHIEDASQNTVANSAVCKKKNQLKCEIASRKLLIKRRKE